MGGGRLERVRGSARRLESTINVATRTVAEFLTKYDVILTPTLGAPPPKLGYLDTVNLTFEEFHKRLFDFIPFTWLHNVTGLPAGQHLVENDAEGEDIASVIDLGAARLLGRHVGDGSHDDPWIRFASKRGLCFLAAAFERLDQFGQAEVDDLGVPVLGEHDVGGLQIAVDDALVMSPC